MKMIERVAREIAKAQTQTDTMWQAFLPEARAAIEAMRRLTDEVEEALDRVPGGWGRGAWAAGVDAALNEQVTA